VENRTCTNNGASQELRIEQVAGHRHGTKFGEPVPSGISLGERSLWPSAETLRDDRSSENPLPVTHSVCVPLTILTFSRSQPWRADLK
jgi:hypothetical protein